MHAEEIDEPGNVVRAKGSVTDFFAAGPDDDRMEFVVLANSAGDQPGPIDGHGIGGLSSDDPERRFVCQIPSDDCAFVGIMPAELGSEICFEAQHFWIGMRMSAVSPGNIPICFSYFSANE